MSKFKKGESGNPSGRPKGARNKTSLQIRQAMIDLLSDNVERLTTALNSMNDEQAARLIISMMKHLTHSEVNPERLSEFQLQQIVDYLKNQKSYENES